MTRQITVAITLHDNDEASALLETFRNKFGEECSESYSVTAMSTGNEFSRIELIERAIEVIEDRYSLVDEINQILAMPTPEKIDPEEHFKNFLES